MRQNETGCRPAIGAGVAIQGSEIGHAAGAEVASRGAEGDAFLSVVVMALEVNQPKLAATAILKWEGEEK